MQLLQKWIGASTNGAGRDGWWAFPSLDRPRFFIDTRSPGFGRDVLPFIAKRRNRLVVRVFVALRKLTRRKPDWHRIKGESELISHDPAFADASFTVYCGTPSILVKDTVRIVSASGQTAGYSKIRRGARAGQSIADESSALRKLAELAPDSSFYPQLLLESPDALVQSAGPSDTRTVVFSDALTFVEALHPLDRAHFSWADSPLHGDLQDRLAHLQNAPEAWQKTIQNGLEHLSNRWRGEIAHHLSHGDLVPWNMRAAEPVAFAFDWEWCAQRPAAYDLCHFLLFQAFSRPDCSVEACASVAIDRLREYSEQPEHLLTAYLLDRLTFYAQAALENGDDPSDYAFIRHYEAALASLLVS